MVAVAQYSYPPALPVTVPSPEIVTKKLTTAGGGATGGGDVIVGGGQSSMHALIASLHSSGGSHTQVSFSSKCIDGGHTAVAIISTVSSLPDPRIIEFGRGVNWAQIVG